MSPKMSATLTPYFTICGADAFITFLVEVFGASVIKLDRHDDEKIKHARIKFHDDVIMLNEANEQYPAIESQTHLYVNSVKTTYQLALDRCSLGLMKPMRRPHGDIMAGFKDPFGNVWWVAERDK